MASKPDIRLRVRVEGGDKLTRKLQMLAQEVAKEHLRKSAEKGAEVFLAEAIERAPEGKTGILKSDMQKEITKETKSKITYGIGPGKKGWYGRLVEYGHRIVVGGRARRPGRTGIPNPEGKVIGHVPPHPFLRPTFDSTKGEAEKAVVKEIRRRLKLK